MEKIKKGDLVRITSSITSAQKSKTYIYEGEMGIALSNYPSDERPADTVSVLVEGKIWGIPIRSIKKV
jgi:hypothetical protein